MIQADKYQQALDALNGILTRARWMAHEAGATEVAELLDATEILPKYIAEPRDTTVEFRATISDIAQNYPICSHLIEDFDRELANARKS